MAIPFADLSAEEQSKARLAAGRPDHGAGPGRCGECRSDRGGRPFRRDHHLDGGNEHRQQLVFLCDRGALRRVTSTEEWKPMAKTDFLTADMTRRQFMKISGRSLAGLTLSASMLSLFGCSQQQVDSRRSGYLGTAAGSAGGQCGPVHRLPALRDQLHPDQRRRVLLLHQPRQDPAPPESGRRRQRPAVRHRQLLCLLPGHLPPV